MNPSRLISVRSLSKTYRVGLQGCTASARALEGVQLDLDRGEVVGLVGPANAGKTTLLRCVAGLLTPDEGTIDQGRAAHGVATVTMYAQDPVELARLREPGESWDVALVDNIDMVTGDVGAAFALLAAARFARAHGGALLLATRDARTIAAVASRIVRLERGRLWWPEQLGVGAAHSSAARVAEGSLRI